MPPVKVTVVPSLMVTVILSTSPAFRVLLVAPIADEMATLLTEGPKVSTTTLRCAVAVLPPVKLAVAVISSPPCPIALMSALVKL